MGKQLTEGTLKALKEALGGDKVSAYLEVEKALESGAFDKDVTKEEADKIVKDMKI